MTDVAAYSPTASGFTPSRDDFAALLEETLGGSSFMEGTVVPGKVVAVEKDFVIVDVGLKTEGASRSRNSASVRTT
jgi:small subunit ribosomal protein S1